MEKDPRLEDYGKKRNFARSPEPPPLPSGKARWPASKPDSDSDIDFGLGSDSDSVLLDAEEEKSATPSSQESVDKQADTAFFMVHKHDASSLHYDLRLEIDGVLASWAVPKGPSLDPSVRRLAIQTEDHPLAYGDFEGRIPEGEYGAGDSLIWDRGSWSTDPPGQEAAMREKGHIALLLDGEKLKGKWHLVRTRKVRGTQQWLLFKAKDEFANADFDILQERPESVESGRRITRGPVSKTALNAPHPPVIDLLLKVWPPMLATAAPPGSSQREGLESRLAKDSAGWWLEGKYDGFRAIAGISGEEHSLQSRNGLDLGQRFPSILQALSELLLAEAVLDGEIVALDGAGHYSFNALQRTTPLSLRQRPSRTAESHPSPQMSGGGGESASENRSTEGGVPEIGNEPREGEEKSGDGRESEAEGFTFHYRVFDLLWLDGDDLRSEPIETRRELLESVLANAPQEISPAQRFAPPLDEALEQARQAGLEGVVAKQEGSNYRGRRSSEWLKLRFEQSIDLAILGYEPLSTGSPDVGSLLLGLWDGKGFRYAGKVGTGFSEQDRRNFRLLLKDDRITQPPLTSPPRLKTAIWVQPRHVVEVAFSEWTPEGRLRHPSLRNLRLDKGPEECVVGA